jgi:DNA polymerase III alpha subunit/nucleotidyltransferase/DNA polymerase involved in DNA repair
MRIIVHLDADAFFASVEQAADTRLRGKPVAVGGERRGIIASASYEARQFGVYTPMPTVRARKLCPKLIVLPGDYERYEQFSRWMFGYCYDFTPEVEQTSIDEGYFDLTANRNKPPRNIALTIRQAIAQSLKISVSEGIGSNKLISQIASKLNKPAAFCQVPDGGEKSFLDPLPNRWLPGVGPKTAARLNAAGLAQIHHIAATPLEWLELLLGSQAPQLRRFAHGLDDRLLIPAREPQKSFSQQETFAQDLTDEPYLEAVLHRMADQLFAQVREERKSVRTLTVKVRYNDMAEDQAGESLVEPTDLETDVYGRLQVLLRAAWKRRVSLRMVSLKLTGVYEGVFRSELALDRDAAQHDARERLARVVDELRRLRGRTILLRGHDFVLKAEAGGRRAEVGSQRSEVGSRKSEVGSRNKANRTPHFHPPHSAFRTPHSALRPPHSALRPPHSALRTPHSALRIPHSALRTPHSALRTPPLPLRVHSHYSFLDSTLSPAAIVGLAQQHGMSAVALTDTGNLHGAVEFAQAASQAGIKPIFGVELRLACPDYRRFALSPRRKTGRGVPTAPCPDRESSAFESSPLLLYVASAAGYHNLCRLLSRKAEGAFPAEGRRQNEEGSVAAQQRAPVTSAFFLQHSALLEGLIAVGADPGLAELFPGRFYLLATRPSDRAALPAPGAACPPIHYARPGDRWKYDILQSIRTLTLLRQEHPEKRLNGRYHFRTPAEMTFACREHPDGLRATHEIAERCRFELPFGKPQFPPFPPPDGSTPGDFLRRLVLEGARRRYRESQILNLKSQIEQELAIINEVGYEEYFLITWDFLQECRRRGIEWITRGSAADSLVCYCLGISSVCPIRFDLYFRRFLNRERMALNKLPDIDIDFAHDVKEDVVKLLFEKYGPEHCAVVGGFSTFQARSAFAEVAKVLGMAEREVRKFTEHFPWGFGGGWVPDEPAPQGGEGLIALLRANPETRDLPLDEEPYQTALRMAEFLDGMPRYPKMHPCGLVLSRQPLHELTPTFVSSKGYPTTHFDMDAVEAVGLVKMDILAQGGLAVMRDVKQSLASRGIDIELPGENSAAHAPPFLERSPATAGSLPRLLLDQGADPARAGVSSRFTASTRDFKAAAVSSGESNIQHPMKDTRRPAQSLGVRCSMFDVRCSRALEPPAEPWQDPAVWDLIAGGNARAVHHIESPAMTGLCRMSNVREIDGLIAIVSVIRPGAANEGKKLAFTRRYQGLEPVTYPHPSLEPCLRSTYGLVVYEEHILQLSEAFAGLPPGRADVLRRALNKQKRAVIDEIRGEFFQSALARGHAPDKTAEVWGLVTGFAGYAFCKAHSTAYGVEAYQSAWLKCYFPAEFMAAVLTNGKGFYHPLVYVLECHRLGIPLLPPQINRPGPAFLPEVRSQNSEVREQPTAPSALRTPHSTLRTPHSTLRTPHSALHTPHSALHTPHSQLPSAIRVPLVRAKGLTRRTIDRLLQERERGPFGSLADFFRRVAPAGEELEIMIRAGAFDEFGESRTRQFWQAQHLVKCGMRNAEGGVESRNAEFDFDGAGQPAICNLQPATILQEPSRRERLEIETDLFGFAVSGHPLELFADVAWDTYCPVSRLGDFVGQTVTTCGLVVEQRTHHQITGEPMKFLSLADWTGIIETELFAQTYKSYGLATVRYPVLEVEARVEPFDNRRGFSLRVLRAGKPRTRPPRRQTTPEGTAPSMP